MVNAISRDHEPRRLTKRLIERTLQGELTHRLDYAP